MSAFLEAFQLIVGEEGGYVNDPRDPGGETMYGISKRAYPNEDIAAMTLGRAREIYLADYWHPVHGDDLPRPWALSVFDTAVNMGVGTAIRLMQDALGVMVDGKLGPRTIAAARDADNRKLARFYALRAIRYAENPNFQTYDYGWLPRSFLVAIAARGWCLLR